MEFRFLFKRKRVSSGQRLLVELRRARNTFIVRRQVALKLSAAFSFCVARHEIEQSSISPVCTRAFVREKLLKKLSYRTIQKNLPVGGFSAVEHNPGEQETAKRFSCSPPREQRSAFPPRTPKGNSAVPFPLPFPHTHKKARENSLAFFACGCTPECNFSPKTGYR